jgi:hypothetical protein
MIYKVGFTGTRSGMNPRQIDELINYLKDLLEDFPLIVFHHGGAVGADAQAHSIAQSLEIPIMVHPASGVAKKYIAELGGTPIYTLPKPPLVRNRDIVDVVDVMLAAPRTCEEELRSGTWYTVRYARKTEVHVHYLFPEDPLILENEKKSQENS